MGIFLKKENSSFVYNEIAKWLDNVLTQDIPEDVVAFCFNIYDDGDSNWSIELVGTQRFDQDDMDWACDEVTDFGTRQTPFAWKKSTSWDAVLEEVISGLTEYLKKGKYVKVLKSRNGIGVGFVDGDIVILWAV